MVLISTTGVKFSHRCFLSQNNYSRTWGAAGGKDKLIAVSVGGTGGQDKLITVSVGGTGGQDKHFIVSRDEKMRDPKQINQNVSNMI